MRCCSVRQSVAEFMHPLDVHEPRRTGISWMDFGFTRSRCSKCRIMAHASAAVTQSRSPASYLFGDDTHDVPKHHKQDSPQLPRLRCGHAQGRGGWPCIVDAPFEYPGWLGVAKWQLLAHDHATEWLAKWRCDGSGPQGQQSGLGAQGHAV